MHTRQHTPGSLYFANNNYHTSIFTCFVLTHFLFRPLLSAQLRENHSPTLSSAQIPNKNLRERYLRMRNTTSIFPRACTDITQCKRSRSTTYFYTTTTKQKQLHRMSWGQSSSSSNVPNKNHHRAQPNECQRDPPPSQCTTLRWISCSLKRKKRFHFMTQDFISKPTIYANNLALFWPLPDFI